MAHIHCPNCGKFAKTAPCCSRVTKPKEAYHAAMPYPNFRRSKQQRQVRYCFLRQIGCNRLLARRIAGWTDLHIALFLENYWERLQTFKITKTSATEIHT